MNSSYEINSEYRNDCMCHEEISLLQEKLAQVHHKFLQQIDICKDQETTIIQLNQKIEAIQKSPKGKHKNIYETFGRPINKENNSPNGRCYEESSEGHQIKNQLLKSDLQAMRHRVLTEITEKNRLLQEMGDLKKRHRKEMAMEIKKFQGLQILYKSLLQEKGFGRVEYLPSHGKTQIDKIQQLLEESELKYRRQRQKNKRIEGQNKQLIAKIKDLQKQLNQLEEKMIERRRSEDQQSSDPLRQMNNLKEQISRINKNINLREVEFNQRNNQRRKPIQQPSPQKVHGQTMLVDSKWRRRQYP